MLHESTEVATHSIDIRHGHAMLLMMIGGAVVITAVAVRAILELMHKSRPEQTPSQPV